MTTLLGTALITGASSGIGAVYADRLANRGHDLIVVARNRQRLEMLARRIVRDTGRTVDIVVADLARKAELAMVEQILRRNASIGILVNNAGIATNANLANADLDRLEEMILVNVLAASRLALTAASEFLMRGQGTIVNISSAAALERERVNGCYSGTKAHLLTLSLKLQQEIAGKGVHVQVVLPGATRTAIWERSCSGNAMLPPHKVMDPYTMVDAAIAGLERGEDVTIPSLPDMAEWETYEVARQRMIPKLCSNIAAFRYGLQSYIPVDWEFDHRRAMACAERGKTQADRQ
jgi:uncharacterized protein